MEGTMEQGRWASWSEQEDGFQGSAPEKVSQDRSYGWPEDRIMVISSTGTAHMLRKGR